MQATRISPIPQPPAAACSLTTLAWSVVRSEAQRLLATLLRYPPPALAHLPITAPRSPACSAALRYSTTSRPQLTACSQTTLAQSPARTAASPDLTAPQPQPALLL